MQAWLVVGSPQNFELLRERGFDLCAFKSSRRKQSSEMQPGDRLVYYLTGDVQFGGIVEVTGEMFEDSDLDAMRRIRSAIDPGELSNRGKMFPDGEAPALLSHGPHPLEVAGVVARE